MLTSDDDAPSLVDILSDMQAHRGNVELLLRAARSLSRFPFHELLGSNAVLEIVACMEAHVVNEDIIALYSLLLCNLLAAVTERDDRNSIDREIDVKRVVDILLRCMEMHANDSLILQSAFLTMAIVMREVGNFSYVLSTGCVAMTLAAMRKHSSDTLLLLHGFVLILLFEEVDDEYGDDDVKKAFGKVGGAVEILTNAVKHLAFEKIALVKHAFGFINFLIDKESSELLEFDEQVCIRDLLLIVTSGASTDDSQVSALITINLMMVDCGDITSTLASPGLIPAMIRLLKEYSGEETAVTVFGAVSRIILMLPEDILPDAAKEIAVGGGVAEMLAFMAVNVDDDEFQTAVTRTILYLTDGDDCPVGRATVSAGGLCILSSSMKAHPDNEYLQYGIGVLLNCCIFDDETIHELLRLGCLAHLVGAIHRFPENEQIQANAFVPIEKIFQSGQQDLMKAAFASPGFVAELVACMQDHCQERLQFFGSLVLRQMSKESPEFIAQIVTITGVPLLASLQHDPDFQGELERHARSILRALTKSEDSGISKAANEALRKR